MASSRWSVRARRQWRLFNSEPPVVRITAVGSALVLLVGILAVVGHTDGKTRPQGVASRGRPGAAAGPLASNASSASDSSSSSTGGPAPSGGGGTVGALAGTDAGGEVGTGVAPNGEPLTASDKGVTPQKIHVVFPKADLGPIGQATGLTADEDETTAINAYLKDINDHGGINGRILEGEIVTYNPLDDANMTSLCKDWSDSGDIFAIVDSYGWHDDHQLECTESGHVPLISRWTTVTDWTNRGAPYLWWTGPDQVQVIDNLVATSADVLRSKKYAVIAGDRAGDQRALEYLKDSLSRAGVPAPFSIDSIPFNEQAASGVIPAIVTKYHVNNVRVVLPIVEFLAMLQFLQQEDSQYTGTWDDRTDPDNPLPDDPSRPPRLLLSDYESEIQGLLGIAETKYAKELQGSTGPTAFKLGDQEAPPGYTDLGRHCSDAVHAYDPSMTSNLEGPGADMMWCQNIYLFAQAATMAGNNLTRDGFNAAMRQIQGFTGGVVNVLTFGQDPYVYAGPQQYRTVEIWVNDRKNNKCTFFQSDGGPQGSCWLIKSDWGPALRT